MKPPPDLIVGTLVPHAAFQEAIDEIEQAYSYAGTDGEPICLAVLGESRTGKSRVQKEFLSEHAPSRDKDGISIPVLCVSTPSNPTAKGLARTMLHKMGDPLFDKGTEDSMTVRLHKLFAECGTRMVMVDEFQHFYDKAKHRVQHHATDYLKLLVDDARVALVISGLPRCTLIIEQNEQLVGRFHSPILMPRFDWDVPESREEFIGILEAFDKKLREYFDLPSLHDEEMAFRFYCGSGGILGYVVNPLRHLVLNAITCNKRALTLQDFDRAYKKAIWEIKTPIDVPQPFSRKFRTTPSTELLARVKNIGVAIEPPPPPRRYRGKRSTVAQVLTT